MYILIIEGLDGRHVELAETADLDVESRQKVVWSQNLGDTFAEFSPALTMIFNGLIELSDNMNGSFAELIEAIIKDSYEAGIAAAEERHRQNIN